MISQTRKLSSTLLLNQQLYYNIEIFKQWSIVDEGFDRNSRAVLVESKIKND